MNEVFTLFSTFDHAIIENILLDNVFYFMWRKTSRYVTMTLRYYTAFVTLIYKNKLLSCKFEAMNE